MGNFLGIVVFCNINQRAPTIAAKMTYFVLFSGLESVNSANTLHYY